MSRRGYGPNRRRPVRGERRLTQPPPEQTPFTTDDAVPSSALSGHPRQNLLTRFFTAEYSMWFDLFLPGLFAVGSPIPLGGTSNHFKMAALRELGAWDPFNVAEDADLGMRIARSGLSTAV